MKCAMSFILGGVCIWAGAASDIKVGVLPFADATASGGASLGESLGRATQAEIVHFSRLDGKVILLPNGLRPDQLDSGKILQLGRENQVDLILLGTVLEAQTEQSSHSGSGPSIFGQSVGGGLHSTKATVTLQADIYDVSLGKKVDSLRLTDSQSDRKISGNVYTSLGSIDTNSAAFQNSTLGKALRKVISDVVKHLETDAAKVVIPPDKPN